MKRKPFYLFTVTTRHWESYSEYASRVKTTAPYTPYRVYYCWHFLGIPVFAEITYFPNP